MAAKKYWVALGEHAAFTEHDRYVLQILYSTQSGGSGRSLTPKFIEADDFESARIKLHAFIDEHINHELHMLGLEAAAAKSQQKREAFKAGPKIEDSEVTSISIGEFVNDGAKKNAPISAALLNLEELL